MKKFHVYCLALSLLVILPDLSTGIRCYECESETGYCHSGLCDGEVCVRIEARTDQSTSVSKGCSNNYELPSCVMTNFIEVLTLRCTCNYNFCNSDYELGKSGMEPPNFPRSDPYYKRDLRSSSSNTVETGQFLMPMSLLLFYSLLSR